MHLLVKCIRKKSPQIFSMGQPDFVPNMLTRNRKRKMEEISNIDRTKRLSVVLTDTMLPNVIDTQNNSIANTSDANEVPNSMTVDDNKDEEISIDSLDTTEEISRIDEQTDIGSNNNPGLSTTDANEVPNSVTTVDDSEDNEISIDSHVTNEDISGTDEENDIETLNANDNTENEMTPNASTNEKPRMSFLEIISLRNKCAEYKMVPGSRLNSELLYTVEEKQLYKKNKRNAAGHMGYTCRESKCNARVYVRQNGECYFSENYMGHRHNSVEGIQKKLELKNDIKKDCAELLDVGNGSHIGTVSDIFYAKVTTADDDCGLDFNQMKRNMLQIRRNSLPKSPTNAAEIIAAYENSLVQKHFGWTMRKDEARTMFYKHAFECPDFTYCVFASDDVINAALTNVEPANRKIYMDATFRVCPLGSFNQLLIIHTKVFGQVLPCIYVLMSNKSQACYEQPYRTTGPVEAYNGVLGKKIPPRTHFFCFVRHLLVQERNKAYVVKQLVNSGGASFQKKTSSTKRDEFIALASDALKRNDIDAMVFLQRVSYKGSKLCDEMLEFENLSMVYVDEDDDVDGENDIMDQQEERLCRVCFDRNRNCVLDPCNRVFFCMECYERWANVNPATFESYYEGLTEEELLQIEPTGGPRCPVCREEITAGRTLLFA